MRTQRVNCETERAPFARWERVFVGLAIALGLGHIALAQRPGGYPPRPGPEMGPAGMPDQASTNAATTIQTVVTEIISNNFAKLAPLRTGEVNVIRTRVEDMKRYAGRFTGEQRGYLAMLEALLAFYAGQKDAALQAAKEAYAASPDNWDTGDLLVSLALAYEDYDSARKVLKDRLAGRAVLAELPSATPLPTPSARPEPNKPGAIRPGEPNQAGAAKPAPPTDPEAAKWLRIFGGAEPTASPAPPSPASPYGVPGTSPEPALPAGPPRGMMTTYLQLPTDYMPYENLGDTFNRVLLHGYNGSFLYYEPARGQILCLLLWSLREARQPGMGEGAAPTYAAEGPGEGAYTSAGFSGLSPDTADQVPQVAYDLSANGQQMTQLFLRYGLQARVFFAGLDFDPPAPAVQRRVLTTLAGQPWPWLTGSAADPINAAQWRLQGIRGAVLLLVDTQGKIRYMGPVGGFLPRLLLEQELQRAAPLDMGALAAGAGSVAAALGSGGGPAKAPVPAASAPMGVTPPATQPAAAIPAPPQPTAPAPRTQPVAAEDVAQARQMLQTAMLQKRLTPASALQTCDEVLERWPNSPEAEQAKTMIRSILREPRSSALLQQRKQQGKYTGE